MAISFYKMFGYPTGVGALVVKRTFLTKLARPWFAGGTVDVVQVPGSIVTMSPHVHERFEVRSSMFANHLFSYTCLWQDGTINYLSLPAITNGLRFLAPYLPLLPLRLSTLTRYLIASLEAIRYPSGTPVVRVLSTRPGRRLRHIGEQSDAGSVVSVVFLSVSCAYDLPSFPGRS
jgi:molybdenum cofactor sulfurtransferase